MAFLKIIIIILFVWGIAFLGTKYLPSTNNNLPKLGEDRATLSISPAPKITLKKAKGLGIKPTPGIIAFLKIEYDKDIFQKENKFEKKDEGIYFMNSDGTNLVKAVDFLDLNNQITEANLAWSSTGKYLAWTRGSTFEFTEIDSASPDVRQIDVDEGFSIQAFAFSPKDDKLSLVVTSSEGDIILSTVNMAKDNFTFTSKIKLGNAKNTLIPQTPVWLDEDKLVAKTSEGQKLHLSIFKLGHILEKEKDIDDTSAYNVFSLNPKTHELVYSLDSTNKDNRAIQSFWRYNPQTGEKHQINLAIEPDYYTDSINFSPDGSKIIILFQIGDGFLTQIFDLNTTKLVSQWNNMPGVSWYGNNIAVRTGYNASNLGIVDVSTGSTKKIAKEDDQFIIYQNPVWYSK